MQLEDFEEVTPSRSFLKLVYDSLTFLGLHSREAGSVNPLRLVKIRDDSTQF
jgi:hypothetical protein